MEKRHLNLAFDIETDGINSTRLHCIVIQDLDSRIIQEYNDEPYGDGTFDIKEDAPMSASYSITAGLTALMDADNIVSHNGIAYDVPQAQKHYPFFRELMAKHWDTLILSRFYYPNLREMDDNLPDKLKGSHSLEAWGHRLGVYKGNFGQTSDWKEWSQEMQNYCRQDVAVLVKLWKHFQKETKGFRDYPKVNRSS